DGPAFKDGYSRPTIENIHIYPLIAKLLGIIPYEKIDGDLEKVKDLLKD
ncbi:MAG TPA: alkaline phosphatase family protein, partial [Candidatus Marinimicrobia bacterium]|nr:alkaline phosphatase family protein [Candidatus Neomarinimicrobiota bacterium]